MSFQLKDVLTAIGPGASIVFAAWIFMVPAEPLLGGVRLSRALIEQFRARDETGNREENLRDQVLLSSAGSN